MTSVYPQEMKRYLESVQHNGQNLPIVSGLTPKERVDILDNYDDIRADDVIISTYPKAGTHWVMDIATKILLRGDLEAASKAPRPYFELQPPHYEKDGDHLFIESLEEMASLPSPRVLATHLWYNNLPQKCKEQETKIIYVWRNWKDSIVSHHNMTQQNSGSWERGYNHFISADSQWGTWADHIRSYQAAQKVHPSMLVLNYEDMKKDLMESVRKIADFLGVGDLSEETLTTITNSCSIESSRKDSKSDFVQHGISGRWKQRFTVAQSEEVDAILEREGLTEVKFS